MCRTIVEQGLFCSKCNFDLCFFLVFACSKKKPEPDSVKLNFKSGQANPNYVRVLNDFDFLGQLHNEALDFVFQKVAEVKAPENKQLSQVGLDFFLFGANSCKSFVIGSGKFPDV